MKHLHESLLAGNRSVLLPWERMPHWKEYMEALCGFDRKRKRTQPVKVRGNLAFTAGDWSFNNFNWELEQYNKRLVDGRATDSRGRSEYSDWWSYDRPKCYACAYYQSWAYKRPDYPESIRLIDEDRKIEIHFDSDRNVYKTTNYKPERYHGPYDVYAYEIDPRLIDLLDYIFFEV